MNRLHWVWASPPEAGLRALASELERGRLPDAREVLKHNQHRSVWRLLGAHSGLILKHYRGRRGERFKTALLGGRAEREFRAMEEFCRAGLPSARPVAYAVGAGPRSSGESWFLSREVQGATTLHDAMAAASVDGPRVWQLADQAMELVARLHEHPFWHRDLHAGNLLLDPAGQLVVIDLHSIWRVPVLLDRQRWENLARLLYSFRDVLDLDRAPELMVRYARARGVPEQAVVRAVGKVSRRFEADQVRGRAARCMRNSSEYLGTRGAGVRVHRRRSYSPERFERDRREHAEQVRAGAELLSRARASVVSRVAAGEGEARIVKQYLRRGLGAALRARLGLGRARGAWRFARRCRVVGVPTPQGLALREEAGGGAWLVTREVPGAVSLTDWAEQLETGHFGTPDRRRVALAVGHVVGRLSRRGLRHADMSGKNVLLAPGPAEPVRDLRLHPDPLWPRVELVDLDNMRRTRAHHSGALERMLGQLGDLPGLTRGDRRRFEIGFRRGAGRGLPAGVVARARRRTLARVRRRQQLRLARSRN